MNAIYVPFDAISTRLEGAIDDSGWLDHATFPLYLVRDLLGTVRVVVSDAAADEEFDSAPLTGFCEVLQAALGHRYDSTENLFLRLDESILESFSNAAREVRPGVFLVDRLVTGNDWWTIGHQGLARDVRRYSLFSVKGGVGRTTTAAVIALHLAEKGERVLVLDLDLESPGLSSAALGNVARPHYGITDWFVEDLVGQSERIIGDMSSPAPWANNLPGEVHIIPAYGAEPGEYLAKLGRVYMETGETWSSRLARLVDGLESKFDPSVVLLESRSGLHDIGAATVAHLDADVLLFATDSESVWADYKILFRHWQSYGLASRIRERLSLVSALTPDAETASYLDSFKNNAWSAYLEFLYDEVTPTDDNVSHFSFDLQVEEAPHDPLVIYWTRGFAHGASLQDLRQQPIHLAYGHFLTKFDTLFP